MFFLILDLLLFLKVIFLYVGNLFLDLDFMDGWVEDFDFMDCCVWGFDFIVGCVWGFDLMVGWVEDFDFCEVLVELVIVVLYK